MGALAGMSEGGAVMGAADGASGDGGDEEVVVLVLCVVSPESQVGEEDYRLWGPA